MMITALSPENKTFLNWTSRNGDETIKFIIFFFQFQNFVI